MQGLPMSFGAMSGMMMPGAGGFSGGGGRHVQGHVLYVGNVDPGLTESLLYQLFARFGNIISLRIMKDRFTKVSREFGFVTFDNLDAASSAQKTLNNMVHYGRELRVYHKIDLSTLQKDANVVLKNLDKDIMSKDLELMVRPYGEIVSCFVKTQSEAGRPVSLGFGYVQYKLCEHADACIEGLNGKVIKESQIIAEKFIPSSMRDRPGVSNLYLKQFPATWAKAQIETFVDEKFSEFGKILSKAVLMDARLSKYFAFVCFESPEVAAAAQKAMNDFEIVLKPKKVEGEESKEGEETKEGEEVTPKEEEKGEIVKLYVNIAEPKSRRRKKLLGELYKKKNETNIYIRSLRIDVKEDRIREVFGKYGAITSTCIKEWVNRSNPEESRHLFIITHTLLEIFLRFYMKDFYCKYIRSQNCPFFIETHRNMIIR